MNRSGLTFLLFLVALGLAGGTLAEGRRVTRRDRPEAGRVELELELPGALPAPAAAAAPRVAPAALPATVPAGGPGVVVRRREAALSSCSPVEPAVLVARSRAPPILG
jgi:hypothetical protein